jgi:hypothetical protein
MGRSPGSTAYAAPQTAYEQNKGLDRDRDGTITVGDIGGTIQARYNDGLQRPRVPVEEFAAAGLLGPGALLLALGGLGGWYAYDWLRQRKRLQAA